MILVFFVKNDHFETDPLRSTLISSIDVAFCLLIFKAVSSHWF